MLSNNRENYDAIIIGAGISGLVCGCYLAKAGMKVLIAEQHFKPGGYCTSFKRQGFLFDAAAHSFGSYREGGIMRNIFEDLALDTHLHVRRYEPSDVVISPDYRISFWSDISRTVEELITAFPHEASGIKNFFQFVRKATIFDRAALRNKTFKDLLNRFLSDKKLESILSTPTFGIAALPPSYISAFSATMLMSEFFLDGGYYPDGGMQALPNALAKRFNELGGELKLSCLVDGIEVKANKVEGVNLGKEGFVETRYAVSCCDVRQTFFRLLHQSVVDRALLDKIKKMTPTASAFMSYFGLDDLYKERLVPGVSYWTIPHYGLETMYHSCTENKNFENPNAFLIHVAPDKQTIVASELAPFENTDYWIQRKRSYIEKSIRRIENVFPGCSKSIIYEEGASPHTLYRYTLNYNGAAFGWASLPSQLLTSGLTQITSIEGLFLSGHWTTQTQGVSGAAYIGHETAKIILKKYKNAKHLVYN